VLLVFQRFDFFHEVITFAADALTHFSRRRKLSRKVSRIHLHLPIRHSTARKRISHHYLKILDFWIDRELIKLENSGSPWSLRSTHGRGGP